MELQQQALRTSLRADRSATSVDAASVRDAEHLWVVVLAGGEGSRLASITTSDDGVAVPKQFCSVDGSRSLLRTTLDRADRLAPSTRIVPVVAPHHERWWRGELSHLPAANVLVQPASRGTAAGVLLPVLTILRRDPGAMIVVLPSDQHAADEQTLHHELVGAARSSREHDGRPVLLGIQPDEPDTGYGWIVPARGGVDRSARIVSFEEKPEPARARELLREGALWSSFMFAASATALVRLYERALPGLLREFVIAMGRGDAHQRPDPLSDLYEHLECRDFSRDVLEACAGETRVISVPACGWSDLGTPERLLAVPGLRGPLVERARALLRPATRHAAAGRVARPVPQAVFQLAS